jgi:hypothetical protein
VLHNHLWPNTHVDRESGLTNAMNRLREALGDVASEPRYISTVPKRGYRFIASVRTSEPRASIGPTGWVVAAACVLLMLALGVWQHAARDDALRLAVKNAASDQAAFALEQLDRIERGVADADEIRDAARRAAQHSVSLAPDVADGHLALALVYMRTEYRWEDAERELQHYLELTPHSVTGLLA